MTTLERHKEKFSSVDTAWLHMDTPTNLAVITGIISFKDPISYERFITTIENRLLLHRRFTQRVQEPRLPLGLPSWVYDPGFDLNNHLELITLPDPGTHNELQRFVGEQMSLPLDLEKPLWKFFLIENYGSGSALVCRIHHCIADGMALVQVLLSMTDDEPDAIWYPPPEKTKPEKGILASLFPPAARAASVANLTCRSASQLVNFGFGAMTHPSRLVDVAKMGTSASVALSKLLLIGPDRQTILNEDCGTTKRAAWSKMIDLQDVKSIGQRMGATINDILLSAVTGALRRYLEERGEPVVGLNIRTIVPVNLRPPTDTEFTGNRFGLVFLSLPVGIEDPLTRLKVLQRRMDAIKESPEAVVAFGILGTIGLTPNQIEDIIVHIFGLKGTAVMTNVPGPRRPLYLAGSKIDSLMFWVPTPANLGLGVSIISYAGDVILGVSTDEGLVPDPERILEHFHKELEEMNRWGRPPVQESIPEKVSKIEGQMTPQEATPSSEPRCEALTKSGRQCKNRALTGSRTCHLHRSVELP